MVDFSSRGLGGPSPTAPSSGARSAVAESRKRRRQAVVAGTAAARSFIKCRRFECFIALQHKAVSPKPPSRTKPEYSPGELREHDTYPPSWNPRFHLLPKAAPTTFANRRIAQLHPETSATPLRLMWFVREALQLLRWGPNDRHRRGIPGGEGKGFCRT
jgi:hypothetical protein